MGWWVWILVGLGLLAFEVIIPGGIILLFFGAAAVVVGGLVWIGLGGPMWFQWAMFSVLSVMSLLTLRGPILRRLKEPGDGAEQVDSLVGVTVIATGDIAPGAEGKAGVREGACLAMIGHVWCVRLWPRRGWGSPFKPPLFLNS